MGKDTHALSGPAQSTALEVLAANEVQTIIQKDDGVTPTPVISRAILVYNRDRTQHRADGVVITPSHNPPEDGGFKYNPPHGGPGRYGCDEVDAGGAMPCAAATRRSSGSPTTGRWQPARRTSTTSSRRTSPTSIK
jgi:hypothetical protein